MSTPVAAQRNRAEITSAACRRGAPRGPLPPVAGTAVRGLHRGRRLLRDLRVPHHLAPAARDLEHGLHRPRPVLGATGPTAPARRLPRAGCHRRRGRPSGCPCSTWQTNYRQIIASTLYVQNWVLAADSVDYLASDQAPAAAQHYWSLSIEEQFYLVWPLLILAAVVWARRRSSSPTVATWLAIGVPTVASLVFSHLDHGRQPVGRVLRRPRRGPGSSARAACSVSPWPGAPATWPGAPVSPRGGAAHCPRSSRGPGSRRSRGAGSPTTRPRRSRGRRPSCPSLATVAIIAAAEPQGAPVARSPHAAAPGALPR